MYKELRTPVIVVVIKTHVFLKPGTILLNRTNFMDVKRVEYVRFLCIDVKRLNFVGLIKKTYFKESK